MLTDTVKDCLRANHDFKRFKAVMPNPPPPPVRLKITVDDQQARDQLERLAISLDQFNEVWNRAYNKGVYSDPVVSNWSHVIDSTK